MYVLSKGNTLSVFENLCREGNVKRNKAAPSGKRDLPALQKRSNNAGGSQVAKEACLQGKRAPFTWQKRPIAWQKSPVYMTKEPYCMAKETCWLLVS